MQLLRSVDPDTGEAALHVAVSLNHENVVQQLLELGSSLSVQDNGGLTPVMTACQYGHLQALEKLGTRGISSTGEWVWLLDVGSGCGSRRCGLHVYQLWDGDRWFWEKNQISL